MEKRLAFTLSFNALHHLRHGDYAERLAPHIDHWVFVEGAAGNGGSTRWCRAMPARYHDRGHSVDGTLEWLHEFARTHENVTVVTRDGWASKDAMVDAALETMRYQRGMLWQIDADEQWEPAAMQEAERQMLAARATIGVFRCNYYYGPGIIVQERNPYVWRRLWRWVGQPFVSHEPPVLRAVPGDREVRLPQTFEHYAYYFEKDVKFKDEWYGGHEGIYQRWQALQRERRFPQPMSYLFGNKRRFDGAQLVKITPKQEARVKVNFGAGGNRLEGWTNHDIEVDIRKRLPYRDNSVEAVFAEHVVEHTTPQQAFRFLEECYRILAPGGYCRITVPSVVQVATGCNQQYIDFAAKFGAERSFKGAISGLIFNHGHESVWDVELLLTYFRAVGFSEPRQAKLYESPYGCLEGHHKVIGREWNDLESISVEARK